MIKLQLTPLVFSLNIKGLKNDGSHSDRHGHIDHGGSYGIKSSDLQYENSNIFLLFEST